jgi:hypothetical protein
MLAVATIVGVSISGHATSLASSTRSLGGNKATVGRCDSDGFTVTPTVVGLAATVTGLTVGGVNAACAGQTLSGTLNNGTANSSGSSIVPAGGGTVTITLATAVTGTDGMEADITVSG